MTHFLEYFTTTTPMFRLAGLVKLVTAIASWATVVALIPITPQALAMKSPSDLEEIIEQRTNELAERERMLILSNEQLQREVEERRHVEALLRREQVHVQELNVNLERRVEERTRELAASNQELESFAYSVAHDLRSPLRAIDGFAHSLHEDLGRGEVDRMAPDLERIRTAARRMDLLITALLKLSRVTRVEIHREDIDASALVASIVHDLAEHDKDRQVEAVIEPDVHLQADANLTRVLLTNLLENAWKFTQGVEDPRIEFGRLPNGACFVRDNGVGFNMEYENKLFRPFERLHSGAAYPGSGIGLATAKRVVTKHGGSIRAEGQEGRGAQFEFTL